MPQAKIGVIGGSGLYDILIRYMKGIFLGVHLEPLLEANLMMEDDGESKRA